MTKKSKLLTARIFGIIFMVTGAIISLFSVMSYEDPELITSSDISYKYMQNYEYYNFKELTVIDCYDKYEYHDENIADEWYFIVAFNDTDGKKYYASMLVETDKEEFENLRRYSDAPTGDYKLNAVVDYVSPIEENIYDEYTANCYREAVLSLVDGDIVDSGYGFDYCCAPESFEKYTEQQLLDYQKADKIILAVGIVMLAIGIALTVLGFRKSLKAAERQEEEILLNYGQGDNQYTYTGAYYNPSENNDFNG